VTSSSLTKCFGLGPHRSDGSSVRRTSSPNAHDVMLAAAGALPVSHAQLFAHALAHLPHLATRSRRLLGDKRTRVEAWLASEQPRFAWSGPKSGLFGLATLLAW